MRAENAHAHNDDRESTSTTVFGFWIYLMTDAMLFATLFATYAVLFTSYAGGEGPRELFELPFVAVETFLLLVSSTTYGFAMIAARAENRTATLAWLGLTFALGAGFLGMEMHEFGGLIAEGNGPARSAFLSGFFTLVGTHGLHVAAGLVWIAVMVGQVVAFGFSETIMRRLMCLSLFWHFLDVVWICVFSIVYLLGVILNG
jgi:cytochrome o ubiquinol oxidase subunit 3